MSYTETELKLIKLAADVGAKAAILTMAEKEKIDKKSRKDRKLHNTRMLLDKYRMFIENATYKREQIEAASAINWLNEMYDPNNKADQIVASIMNSAVKTKIMVAHINKMLKIYEIYCNLDNSSKMKRRFEAFNGRYISKKRVRYETIAENWNVDVRTIQNDVNEAVNDFSSLLFGIDWISKNEEIM